MESSYNLFLVALSFVVSVMGSYTALQLATGIPGSRGKSFWLWLIGAAVALGGCGIWAMHFIAMLAYQLPMEVAYDTGLTILSMLIAVIVVGAGFFIVGRSGGKLLLLLLAGLITGLGVASMHYMGMAAMQMPGEIVYDNTLVGISVVIAVVASIVALWLAFNLRGNWQRIGSAVVMGIAVCGMHYTGMAAASMVHNQAGAAVTSGGLSPQNMAIGIFAVVTILLVTLLVTSMKQAKAVDEYTYQSL